MSHEQRDRLAEGLFSMPTAHSSTTLRRLPGTAPDWVLKAIFSTKLWRKKQLQYTWLRSLQNRHIDFWQVTADALDFALASLEFDDQGLRESLMSSYLALDAYPEATEVLDRIRSLGITTAILSNGSPRMLRSAVQFGDRAIAGCRIVRRRSRSL